MQRESDCKCTCQCADACTHIYNIACRCRCKCGCTHTKTSFRSSLVCHCWPSFATILQSSARPRLPLLSVRHHVFGFRFCRICSVLAPPYSPLFSLAACATLRPGLSCHLDVRPPLSGFGPASFVTVRPGRMNRFFRRGSCAKTAVKKRTFIRLRS